MVWKLARRGIRAEFILFDNRYASKENLALFECLGLYRVSRTKENAKVYFQEQRLSVKEVGAQIKRANYHYYPAVGARVRSFEVKLVNRLVKLTVIKDDTAPETGRTKYLITNALRLSNLEHLLWYRRRVVEVLFRDARAVSGFE